MWTSSSPQLRQTCAPFPEVHGPGGYEHRIAGTYGAYPDARFVVEDVIAEGDRVVVRCTLRGTHMGESRMGVSPTGQGVAASIIVIFRLAGGTIVENYQGLVQQSGVLPTPQRADA